MLKHLKKWIYLRKCRKNEAVTREKLRKEVKEWDGDFYVSRVPHNLDMEIDFRLSKLG